MVEVDRARDLASALVRVARGSGLECHALLTSMDRPLGDTIGNALEVREAIATLEGGGPEDLRALTLALVDHPRAAEVLASGAAAERFRRMVAAQGGDPDGELLGSGVRTVAVKATRSGTLMTVDAGGAGRAAFLLGAGRRRAEDPVDHGVGITILAKPGAVVAAGDDIAILHHRDGHAMHEARTMLEASMIIGDGPAIVPPLVRERVSG